MPHTPSSTDPFRINMKFGYAGTLPATPPPISPATSWWDVSNWQSFLQDYGFFSGSLTNNFDLATQMATKNFQMSSAYPPVLTATGIVNQATYNKAVAAGMTPYPTVIT